MRIQDLKVGMRVQTNDEPAPDLRRQTGIIMALFPDYVMVRLDQPLFGIEEWSFWAESLDSLDPELIAQLEDQKRREAHADKWL